MPSSDNRTPIKWKGHGLTVSALCQTFKIWLRLLHSLSFFILKKFSDLDKSLKLSRVNTDTTFTQPLTLPLSRPLPVPPSHPLSCREWTKLGKSIRQGVRNLGFLLRICLKKSRHPWMTLFTTTDLYFLILTIKSLYWNIKCHLSTFAMICKDCINTVIPQYSQGSGSRTPKDTKIHI